MRFIIIALFLALAGCAEVEKSATSASSVKGKAVEYHVGDQVFKGYLAYDAAISGKRPGVIVVHEWWGHNAYARHRADMLAKLGYTALAIDMYGDGKQANHPDEAGKFAMAAMSNVEGARARFDAGLQFLKQQPQTDATQLAAIGYCFGGAVVLNMARLNSDLDAVVSFHGGLQSVVPIPESGLHAKVLVCNGEDDVMVTPEQIAALKAEMDAAGADYEFISYAGAKHSFTNPGADSTGAKFGLPLAYNAQADQASWTAMLALFNRVFQPQQ